jgi:hypothetical protein
MARIKEGIRIVRQHQQRRDRETAGERYRQRDQDKRTGDDARRGGARETGLGHWCHHHGVPERSFTLALA